MTITVKRDGQRVYFEGDTYRVRDRIKGLGGHWDGERRAWWVGAAKEAEARQLAEALAANAGAVEAPAAREDPDSIRLSGKGEYKGRTYYLGARTRDGRRVRCLTLPDAQGDYLDFWADAKQVRVVKEYRPREVRSGYRGRTHTEHTTLGGIARFVAQERRNRAEGGAVCAECGKSGELVRDLEDGGMKHPWCCDIEP